MGSDTGAEALADDPGDFGDDFGFWDDHPRFDSANNRRFCKQYRLVRGGVWQNFWESRTGRKSADLSPRLSTEDLLAGDCVFAFVKWIFADG